MVGIVIVSHSKELANAIVNYTKIMAANANVASAGGMEDGGFGTSYEKIKSAIDSVYSDDGVIVLMDLALTAIKSYLDENIAFLFNASI